MSTFVHNRYFLKKQMFVLAGGHFRIYDPQNNLVYYSQMKAFKLKEDIRVYADEGKTSEVLTIKARQVIDFGASYDIVDSTNGEKVGALRRKGMKSLVQDEWLLLDVNDQPIGTMKEDSLLMGLFRRFGGSLFFPQKYAITIGYNTVASLKQNFNPFTYRLTIDFSMDSTNQLDKRMGMAAAILLAAIEGRQS